MGYSAFEPKNSGIVIAWPMPISRSRDMARPAMVIDRHEKNAVPSITMTTTPSQRSGLSVSVTPRIADSTRIATAWVSARMPAANAFPVISAARGVGVTRSLASTPASRSQMIWMP
jgi:hypothetical protein